MGKKNNRDDREMRSGDQRDSRALTKSDLYSEDYRMTPEFSSGENVSEYDPKCYPEGVPRNDRLVCCSRESCLGLDQQDYSVPHFRDNYPQRDGQFERKCDVTITRSDSSCGASCCGCGESVIERGNDPPKNWNRNRPKFLTKSFKHFVVPDESRLRKGLSPKPRPQLRCSKENINGKNNFDIMVNQRARYANSPLLRNGNFEPKIIPFQSYDCYARHRGTGAISPFGRAKGSIKMPKYPYPEVYKQKKSVSPKGRALPRMPKPGFDDSFYGKSPEMFHKKTLSLRHPQSKNIRGKFDRRKSEDVLPPRVRDQYDLMKPGRPRCRESTEWGEMVSNVFKMTDSIVTRFYSTFQRRKKSNGLPQKTPKAYPGPVNTTAQYSPGQSQEEVPKEFSKILDKSREQRMQIKTLEDEIVRLRSVKDETITKPEVNPSDVKWRPADILGEGTFSVVYKGTFCGTDIAVKELKRKLSQDDQNYFQSEAALLQQLHHPRIVLLMGVCTTSTRPFMLLEYLSGGSLYGLIHEKTRERLDHAAYFSIAKDVAQGLNYLHKHNPQVLHLDLKSMNVLLDNHTRAKIGDFGFSILKRTQDLPIKRGFIRGTPAWMAPELLMKGDVSPKCDVYSYGIMLWEMLTAARPFEGHDLYGIITAIEGGVRPTLPKGGLSQELKELITSCWAQNASLRPSFEEILGALETASLPSSWRTLLSKANIAPSEMNNINTARDVIGLIQESVDVLEELTKRKNSKQLRSRRKTKMESGDMNDETGPRKSSHRKEEAKSRRTRRSESNSPDKIYERIRVVKTKPSISPSPSRYEGKGDRNMSTSPVHNKEHRQRERGRRGKSSGKRDRKPRRDIHESTHSVVLRNRSDEIRDARRRERRHKKQVSNFESPSRRKKDLSKTRDGARYDHRDVYDEAESDESYQSDYSDESSIHSSYENDIYDYVYKNTIGKRSPSGRMHKKHKSPLHSPKQRQSPRIRASPARQNRSPAKSIYDTVEFKDQVKSHTKRTKFVPITPAQLLNQKKRLRPVQPSTLRDLSLLTEDSIQDISLLLKRAMANRRAAFDQTKSCINPYDSHNMNWSELY